MTTAQLLTIIRHLHTALAQADVDLTEQYPGESLHTVCARMEALIAGAHALSLDTSFAFPDLHEQRILAQAMAHARVGGQL